MGATLTLDNDIVRLEAEIDEFYDELRILVGRAPENPELDVEIDRKRKQLHTLQAEAAAAMRRHAEARLPLKPGEGYRILEQAKQLLES